MKSKFTIAFLFLICTSINAQTQWAETGSDYYMRGQHVFGPPFYFNYIVTGDTTVQSQACKIFKYGTTIVMITYSENDQIFLYDGENENFRRYFDFSLTEGDHYFIPHIEYDSVMVSIDEVSSVQLNGFDILIQKINYYSPDGEWLGGDEFYQNIGSIYSVIPFWGSGFESLGHRVCSFNSPTVGEHIFDNTNCSFSSDFEIEKNIGFHVFPNPSSGQTKIHYNLPSHFSNIKIQATNIYGQIIHSYFPKNIKGEIELSDLSPGLYFISIFSNDELIETEKLIVSQ